MSAQVSCQSTQQAAANNTSHLANHKRNHGTMQKGLRVFHTRAFRKTKYHQGYSPFFCGILVRSLPIHFLMGGKWFWSLRVEFLKNFLLKKIENVRGFKIKSPQHIFSAATDFTNVSKIQNL